MWDKVCKTWALFCSQHCTSKVRQAVYQAATSDLLCSTCWSLALLLPASTLLGLGGLGAGELGAFAALSRWFSSCSMFTAQVLLRATGSSAELLALLPDKAT